MGKIVELDDILSNKIAAGEVVERPASVVKELVENAIDAKSTRIEIEIENGGLDSIRVLDNGEGIEKDDCLIAFRRHATSKIKDENDLFHIHTLGFRGEALPSIASVSHVELKSSTGDTAGTYVAVHGGKLLENKATNSRKGTDIRVTKLFHNTPARLKHLKTVHTELGNITDYVYRLAMAHPEISFKLTHNGNRILFTNGNGDLLQVAAAIYGMSVAKKMLPVSFSSLDFKVSGLIAKPEITRASRHYISIFINGRFIKNYPVNKAILDGYHTLLPIGRYPIVILSIVMDPTLVDINVHPAKLEARLSKEHELTELIKKGIIGRFKSESLIPEDNKKVKLQVPITEQKSFVFDHTVSNQFLKEYKEPTIEVAGSSSFEREMVFEEQPVIQDGQLDKVETSGSSQIYTDEPKDNREATPNSQAERLPPLYPIGQMHGTYIFAQNENGLYMIDQHAAQERIKYEYFRNKVGEVAAELQDLLVPITFDFTHAESMLISQHLDELRQVGVFLEPFGAQSYIARSHPQWFPRGEEKELIEEIVEQILTEKKVSIHKLREEAAIMMSCKGSIKANHHLRNDEIFELLETLRKAGDPFTCPHGRPIIIHFTNYEMEKMFKRVM